MAPTLLLALLLFAIGQKSVRGGKTPTKKYELLLLWLILGTPGFLFALYYLHWFDNAKWFYEFRSIPLSELTAAGAGLFAGAISELTKNIKFPARSFFLISFLCFGISIPYLKPILGPLDYQKIQNKWERDVCMQSTFSTCGAACAATVFKTLGINLTEREIAKECFSCEGGTENWYVARLFRKMGFQIKYRIEKGLPQDLHTPAIAGVLVGGAGHFIAIQDQTEQTFITGDPLSGYREIPKDKITTAFKFTGFFMEVQ